MGQPLRDHLAKMLLGTLVTLSLMYYFYFSWQMFLPSHENLPSPRNVIPPVRLLTTPKPPAVSATMRQTTAVNPQRGPLTNCTLADIQRRPGVMVLSSTNFAFLDITLNLLASIRKTGVCVNTTIVAADDRCLRYLQRRSQAEPGLNVLRMRHGNDSGKLSLNSAKYRYLTNQRPGYLLSFIEQGYEVLYTDADTYWFKDPFPYFKQNFDVAMLDEHSLDKKRSPVFCDGFGYFKPTGTTKEFLRSWVKEINQHPSYTDQGAMNNVIVRMKSGKHKLNILSLNMSLFPGGLWYYNPSFYKKHRNETVAMHSSYVINHDAKVEKYKQFNMWHYNATKVIP